jgi:hypothetical protein
VSESQESNDEEDFEEQKDCLKREAHSKDSLSVASNSVHTSESKGCQVEWPCPYQEQAHPADEPLAFSDSHANQEGDAQKEAEE